MFGQAYLHPETKEVIPVTWEEYLQKSREEDWNESKVVKQTYLRHYWVSTIFLGLEHGGGMWFETYIFRAKGKKGEKEVSNWSEVYGKRFRTYAEALANHEEVLAYYKANRTVPKY